MDTEQPSIKISVIIPVYNSRLYLEQCVQSVCSQSLREYEILLIDDGSTDGSAELCDRLAKNDARIKVTHQGNKGICEARNLGITQALGEYVAFVDHDDRVKPGFLEDNYRLARSCSADILKFGRESIVADPRGHRKSIHTRRFPFRVLNKAEIQSKFLELRFREAMNCVWDGLFRRDFLMANHLRFDPVFRMGGEDIAFCSACFLAAERIAFQDKVYYEHYLRKGYSTSTKADPDQEKRYENLIRNLDFCLNQKGVQPSTELYLVLISKEAVYPSLVYYLKRRASRLEIDGYLASLRWPGDSFDIRNIRSFGLKWGVFAYLLFHRRASALIQMVKLRKWKEWMRERKAE